MYACLGVTCHLHFWQNDRCLLRGTRVTRGWNGHPNKSAHKVNSAEEDSPAAPARIRTSNVSMASPAFLTTSYSGYLFIYGVVPKGLLTFLGFFLCNAEFSPCWALPEYIRALIYLACLRVFSVTPWVIVYRLYRVR